MAYPLVRRVMPRDGDGEGEVGRGGTRRDGWGKVKQDW